MIKKIMLVFVIAMLVVFSGCSSATKDGVAPLMDPHFSLLHLITYYISFGV